MLENKIRKFVLRKGLLPGSPFLFYTVAQYILIAVSFIYTVLRAFYIPITHDEAGTILNFSTQSIWDIITYRDPIPNNHILNTLLIKISTSLFGFNELSCRLPNLIGGLGYFLIAFKLSRIFFQHSIFLRICFQVLMIANPYVVEFFSLARGYGLSVSLMLFSIYFVLSRSEGNVFAALVLAVLAVYTNITQLNYMAPMLIVILYLAISQHFFTRTFMVKVLSILLLLGVLLVVPISKMMNTDQFKYWGNSGFWNETFLPLLKSSIQGEGYFSQSTVQVFIIIILLSALFSLFKTVRLLIAKKIGVSNAFIVNFIFFGTIVYNVMQHILFEIPYLNARTSILFYPLFVLAISASISEVNREHYRKPLLVLYGVAGIFGLLHITRTYNLHSSYEWWYDGDNKKVINRMERSVLTKPLILKCNWIFQPSLTFYTKAQGRKQILPPPYQKSIDTAELADYYYITSDDLNDWFNRNYTIDTSFAWNSRYLMKKK